MDLRPRCRVRGRGAAIEGHDPHALHQRGDMQTAQPLAFLPKPVHQYPAASKGRLHMPRINPAHQGQIGSRGVVIHAAPTDSPQPGLPADTQAVRAVHQPLVLGMRSAWMAAPSKNRAPGSAARSSHAAW